MKLEDLRNVDKDELLGLLGLETRRSAGGWWLGTLGTFALGALVGAAGALLLAPKAGSELRDDLRTRVRRDGKAAVANGSDAPEANEAT